MSPEYGCLVAFRIFSTIFVQNGYIHPDEYFQTTEIITGDVFGVIHDRPWEFNKNTPLRSIGLLYGIFGIPLYIAKWIFKLYKIPWNPFLLLFVFRSVTCAMSFITDYSLYKICKILKLKPNRYLLLLSSSYVIIVFGTKTFTNSLELALVSLLLWRVVDSMAISEKVLSAENEIRNMYAFRTSITDKVVMCRKLRLLPSHNFSHCLEIGTILAVGTFNRPTFLLFAVTPIFYWVSRGFYKNNNRFIKIFNIRIIVLFICTLPGIFMFILIDSFYFEHITENEASLVITPLNFIYYNIQPSNLAEHGIHFRMTHTIINMPLLFNVLSLLFLGRLQFNSFIKIILKHHYHLLPNIYEVKTLMMANVFIPLILLSIFPHQEPRFLLPLLLPIVFSTCKYFSSHSMKNFKHILPVWCFSNIIGFIFYGYMHQAGITPMISHLFQEIKDATNTYVINSHTYSIPVGLLMIPKLNESLLYMNQRHITVYDLGSSLDPNSLYDTVMNISQHITHKEELTVYFALSGPLTKQFESVSNVSSLAYTKKIFFPHLSMESLRFYFTSMIDLFYHDNNMPYISLTELRDVFSLILYKITIKTE
ncbi:GPI mannosyltransferase 4 [Aphis craccivora]|uniref:Mannosyltransferase n=1 Tax=Aphis craccivora TaxID=307492 RepID=A0A6G0Y9S4_APHCR|nr:GPI mannosyltransferase 4 [Aphis craccivora]